jgi:DNA mismatch repair protein MutL
MADIIQLLPDAIANQIAAGEVVQRPASAVKELMENAIDAKAQHIRVIIKDAGKTLIQVMDDGTGMSETDARMSLERHATSKIRTAEDLFSLHTMGFRGEALASIAAVSQLEIRTRMADRELGTWLVVEGSEVKRQEPVACNVGTSISVKNLFFNVPARRNFLKSNPVELKHIMDEFQRLALAHPSVAFSFIQGDEVVFDLPASRISQRIVNLFGKNYQEQLAACREETEYVQVNGFVGKPEFARKTRGEQFLFVNNRFIRSNYLHHAIMNAFEGLLPDQSFPFYVLFISLDPRHIDVNVHPTKTEIKFDDERAVYAVLRSAVRQALGFHNLAPALDFTHDVNIITKLSAENPESVRKVYDEERFSTSWQRTGTQPWQKLFDESKAELDTRVPTGTQTTSMWEVIESPEASQATPVVLMHQRFLVQQVPKGIMLVDYAAATERILYERFLHQLSAQPGESQQCLFPQPVTFPVADFTMISEMAQEISDLGFRFENFGKNTLVVTGIPAGLPAGNEKELMEGLLDQFKHNQAELSLPIRENLARALAKRAAEKPIAGLSATALRLVTEQLFNCKNPNYTPEGVPTFRVLELAKIESYFNRS